MAFSKIEVITSMDKLEGLQSVLEKVGATGMTVLQAIGCGVQKGTQEYESVQRKTVSLLPKQYVMVIVEDEIVDKAVEEIKKELYTGHIGDGKIFISPVSNIIRVRTGEEGEDALKA